MLVLFISPYLCDTDLLNSIQYLHLYFQYIFYKVNCFIVCVTSWHSPDTSVLVMNSLDFYVKLTLFSIILYSQYFLFKDFCSSSSFNISSSVILQWSFVYYVSLLCVWLCSDWSSCSLLSSERRSYHLQTSQHQREEEKIKDNRYILSLSALWFISTVRNFGLASV